MNQNKSRKKVPSFYLKTKKNLLETCRKETDEKLSA